MKATSEFHTTDTRPPSENVLRGVFAFYLNTKELDAVLISLDSRLTFKSALTPDVGAAVLQCTVSGVQFRKVMFKQFLEWVETDDLAKFLVESYHVMGALKLAMNEPGPSPEPFASLIGQRFKDLTDFDRKRMPKDIKKSFDIKARNAILKFMKEWENSPNQTRYVREHHEKSGPTHTTPTIEEWFELALDCSHNTYLPYPALRTIHNLLAKSIRVGEDMTDSIKKVRDELAVARVMLS